MKRILITGANSYIGTSTERYLLEYNEKNGEELYGLHTVSLRGDAWEEMDFSPYDSIFHVAGIAHADTGKVSEETRQTYYQVNCDLALKAAKKAREQGVGQFIYMSSVIVFGDSAPVGKRKMISQETPPSPTNFYGDSKLKAEEGLMKLARDTFRVAILRPPMIYGPGCKGNYPLLSRAAKRLPVCPAIDNERSVLYVENLAEFVRRLVDSGRGGIFYPQNAEYASTSELISLIGEAVGKKIRLWRALNPLVAVLSRMPGNPGAMLHKAFGSLTVDERLSTKDFEGYCLWPLKDSVFKTEKAGCGGDSV